MKSIGKKQKDQRDGERSAEDDVEFFCCVDGGAVLNGCSDNDGVVHVTRCLVTVPVFDVMLAMYSIRIGEQGSKTSTTSANYGGFAGRFSDHNCRRHSR